MLKNLKSLFIQEDETAPKTPGKTPQTPPAPPTAPVKAQSSAGQPGKSNPKFMEALIAAMERENLEGIDYMEFKNSLQSLAKMPMDEKTRYQSAMAMATTMGATLPKLLETAAHYLQILKLEEHKFEEALNNQKEERIGQRVKEREMLQNAINEKAEMIQRLTREMEADRQQIDKLQKEVAEASEKVETTKNDFIASYNSLVSQIQLDVDNMNKYLQG